MSEPVTPEATDTEFPFPFFGAGDADYFEWASVSVLFTRAPTQAERDAIIATIPKPIGDPSWHGAILHVGSEQDVHLWIAEAYQSEFEIAAVFETIRHPREFFASAEAVNQFNADIEAWLRRAHDLCPILLAYRMPDWEAGGTEFSPWHEWSLRHLPTIATVMTTLAATDRPKGLRSLVKGVTTMAESERVDVPEEIKDIVAPAWRAAIALNAGDSAEFMRLVGDEPDRFMLKDLARYATACSDAGWQPEALHTMLQVARRELARPKVPRTFVMAAAIAAADAADGPFAQLAGEVSLLAAPHVADNVSLTVQLSQKTHRLLAARRYASAMMLFDAIVDSESPDLTIYANALYAVQADNSGLGVQPERARRYLDACLPYGPRNPGVFINAACVWIELGEVEQSLECLRQAADLDHPMAATLIDDPMFASVAGDPRFRAITEAARARGNQSAAEPA